MATYRGLKKWLYFLAQYRHRKPGKDASVRVGPFADLIIASTALPYETQILCVGPRNLTELNVWLEKGYHQVFGLDLFPESAMIVRGDMHSMPFATDSFGLVTGVHCFEHSFNFNLVAAEVTRVLKVGGWLFAAFPIHFTPTAHDRWDFGSAEGFLRRFEPARLTRLWHRETPTEVAVLARLEAK